MPVCFCCLYDAQPSADSMPLSSPHPSIPPSFSPFFPLGFYLSLSLSLPSPSLVSTLLSLRISQPAAWRDAHRLGRAIDYQVFPVVYTERGSRRHSSLFQTQQSVELTPATSCALLSDPRAIHPAWHRDATRGRTMPLWLVTFGHFSSLERLRGPHRALTGEYTLTPPLPLPFFTHSSSHF